VNVPKFPVLKNARGLAQVFRPVEVTDIDDSHHAFIVRYSGDYIVHTHDKDEFVYILEGELIIEIDGVEERVQQGEAYLVPAGKPHRPRCKNMALGLIIETKGLQKQMDPQV
jgi:mannose-6-phosphate isomerase-like protein (cupin superfamily)